MISQPKQRSIIMGNFWARFLFWFLVILLIVLVASFLNSYKKMRSSLDKIESEKKKIENLEAKNAEVKRKLEAIESGEYIERQIRDKLGLSKEGEIVVILPPEEKLRSLYIEPVLEKETPEKPNWEKWVELLL